MTERKSKIDVDADDTRTLSNMEQFSSDVESNDANLHELDAMPSASNASYSLGRLEQDLRTLQSKWQAVEQEIAERDGQIALLRREMDRSQEIRTALDANLTSMAKDKERLAEELLEQQRQMENDLAKQSKSTSETQDRLHEFESENTSLRVHIQELQAYIDGRKNDWDNLETQLQGYQDAITGMSTSLNSHDEIVAEKEQEKASLARKTMELERELAEMKGRHTEKEASHAKLQQTLEDQSRELGNLNGVIIGQQKDVEKLQKKLEQRDATETSMRRDLKERKRDRSSLEELLSNKKASIAELQGKFDAANRRIADLEAEQKERDSMSGELGMTVGELRERLRLSEPTIKSQEERIAELEGSLHATAAAENVLRDEAAKSAKKLREVTSNSSEFEIRAAEEHALFLESETDRKGLEQELEAQRDLVQVLERELSSKQENLDLLDRSVDRLSAIRSEVRELDFQIDDHWVKEPLTLPDHAEEIFENPDEVMLDPEALLDDIDENAEHVIVTEEQDGAESLRFPLCGTKVTIGRSPGNDIWLRSKFISRVHARIRVDGSRAIIEDAGSTNGFLVNSVETRQHSLDHGDMLEIGDCKLRYLHNVPG